MKKATGNTVEVMVSQHWTSSPNVKNLKKVIKNNQQVAVNTISCNNSNYYTPKATSTVKVVQLQSPNPDRVTSISANSPLKDLPEKH